MRNDDRICPTAIVDRGSARQFSMNGYGCESPSGPDPVRRRVALALAWAFLAKPLASFAQAPRKTPRIGLLIAETADAQSSRMGALRVGLTDLGYVEGATIALEVRTADGHYDRLPALAAELVRLGVDVLVAFGIKALVAAKEATKSTPIVIPSTSSDPVALGVVGGLARRGGNITGSVAFGPEVMAKRLEILKGAIPSVARVGVLENPANPSFGPTFGAMDRAAKPLGISLRRVEVRTPGALDRAFEKLANERVGAIVVQDDTMFAVHATSIAERAGARRLASVGSVAFAVAGGLIGYGANDAALYRRGAYFVDRILRGAKPGDLPIEQASVFELAINTKTAKALDIAVPGSLLIRADRLIE